MKDNLIKDLLRDPNYDVRSNGKVFSKFTKQGHLGTEWIELIGCRTKEGYHRIRYKKKHIMVHRAVYAKFKGQLKSGLQINHIDGNPWNNFPDNLEQVTPTQNQLHRVKLSRSKMLNDL